MIYIFLVIFIILAYLIGSIPFGFILSKLLRGIDIREYGSGNIGATNVWRVVGKPAGIFVLLLDVAKGLIPPIFFANLLINLGFPIREAILRVILGLATISGHNWMVWFKFQGGKGIATGLGVLLALGIKIEGLGIILFLTLCVWIGIVLFSGYVSLASIISSIFLPILMLLFGKEAELVIFSSLLCIFVAYRHKPNIKRLLLGQEPKVFKWSKR